MCICHMFNKVLTYLLTYLLVFILLLLLCRHFIDLYEYKMIRVVSLETFGETFPEIYSHLSENFRKFVKEFITLYVLNIIICFQVHHCKVML